MTLEEKLQELTEASDGMKRVSLPNGISYDKMTIAEMIKCQSDLIDLQIKQRNLEEPRVVQQVCFL
jgi:hypothetical protein